MKDFETIKEYAAYFQGWEAATGYMSAVRDTLRAAKELLNTNTEQRRGRWEDISENGDTAFRCSACHMYLAFWPDWKYCPNCGAKMDGRKVKESEE